MKLVEIKCDIKNKMLWKRFHWVRSSEENFIQHSRFECKRKTMKRNGRNSEHWFVSGERERERERERGEVEEEETSQDN